MNDLAHIEDCEIIRPDSEWEDMARPGLARLCSSDDDYCYFSFPESWTDDQIKIALDFANIAHDVGYKSGKSAKAREIREALGL